jgi:hypothetical protein
MYMHFFRILYNATYLRRTRAQQALEMLSHTGFNAGLVAGVPGDTVVSHKFGERTSHGDGTTRRELHDCGIVYFPGHPYGICVMTEGSDFTDLASVIADISGTAYQYVSRVSE